jgi:hypothetical protein
MTLTRLSLGFALAFGLMAQHARAAQSAESAADEAEAEAPDSVLNKDRNPVVPLDRARQDRQVREAERNNPESVDSRSDLPAATSATRTIADN